MCMCASIRVWSELTATIAKEHTHTNNSNNDYQVIGPTLTYCNEKNDICFNYFVSIVMSNYICYHVKVCLFVCC